MAANIKGKTSSKESPAEPFKRAVAGCMRALARKPDVILLDLWLQGHMGGSFVEAYRALPNATAAVVLLSATHDLEQAAATSGADRYLAKPFDLGELLAMLAELLGTP